MRLLVLTADWSPIEGGIASVSEGVSGGLAALGHAVTVLAPERPGPARPAPEGVRVERWPGYDRGAARWLPFARAALARLGGCDGVLAMNPAYGGVVAGLARAAGGPPYLAWAYGFELLKARASPLGPVYRRLFAAATRSVAISRFTRELLLELGVPSDRIAIVPPGIAPPPERASGDEPRRALGLPGGSRLVLTVGRLVRRKGHAELLAAMSGVLARHPDVAWVVVGRGPCGPGLERAAAAAGLAHRIRFVGYASDALLDALYREATLFALTPLHTGGDAEGFGIVFLEAGARGLPVVAGRSGGVPDAVTDGVTGLLVAPTSPPVIAAAIDRLLGDAALCARLGAAGRERARLGSWDRVAGRVAELLEAAR